MTCRRVDDFDIDVWLRYTYCSRFEFKWIIGKCQGEAARIFGLAEGDSHVGPDTFFYIFHQEDGNRSAGAQYSFQRREIVLTKVGMLQHGKQHGRNSPRIGAVFTADDL